MNFFLVLILSLASFVVANNDGHNKNCRCVNIDKCSDKFSTLIQPRSLEHPCLPNQICCELSHIIHLEGSDENYLPSDSTDVNYAPDMSMVDKPALIKLSVKKEQKPYRQCGLRSKISAHKRIYLPASFASLGEFPWQAAILKNYTSGYFFVSSGSLVDKTAILTTAHSVGNLSPSDTLIRLAENNIQADPKGNYPRFNVKVSKILIKEDFNSDTLENDFAVFCLEKPVKNNDVVSPICLPEPEDLTDDSIYSDKKGCVISGWGKGSYNGNYSTILRKAHLKIVPRDKCQELIRKRTFDTTYVLDKSFICAGGERGKDACTGDAGGPLSCPNKYGQQVLQGMVSWGIGCGEENVPGIYSNIRDPESLEWIKKAIKTCNIRLPGRPRKSPIPFETELFN